MKRLITYILLAVIMCVSIASCGSGDSETVFGTYTDSATSVLVLSRDKTYSGNINGVTVSGEWKYTRSKITVLDGDDSYSGISLSFLPSDDDVKLDAVVYSDSYGEVKLQLNGVIYTKQ